MARWICAYGLLISPGMWLFSKLSCLASPRTFVQESPLLAFETALLVLDFLVTAATTMLLFAGAWQLTTRRRLGPRLLVSGFVANLGWGFLIVSTAAVLFATAASEPGIQHMNAEENSSPALAIGTCVLSLGSLLFEIAALIWLVTAGRELVLHP